MDFEVYKTDFNHYEQRFDFISVGPKGRIRKSIKFTEVRSSNPGDVIFNLSFGDADFSTGSIDDLNRSGNNDTQKVLATVAQAVLEFTDAFPDCGIVAIGSTPARTRLYLMAVGRNMSFITMKFVVWGRKRDGKWEIFERNRPYNALMVQRR